MNAPFFLKRQYFERVAGENLFFPWRSPLGTYDPLNMYKSWKNGYFEIRGILEEKVERQGKVYQNVWDEPTYTLIFFFGP